MTLRDGKPFILLDDARVGRAAAARLYQEPVEIVAAGAVGEVAGALARLREARRDGLHATGWLAYEAGAAFLTPPPSGEVARSAGGGLSEAPFVGDRPPSVSAARCHLPRGGRSLWFGLFEGFDTIAPEDVPALLPDPAGAWCGAPEPAIARHDHAVAMAQVRALIEAGDIYQANLSFAASVRVAGHPLALYAGLRQRARAAYGGVIFDGRDWLLSLSPELFFALHGDRLTARPMKGTARRDADPDADHALAAELVRDPKQRAENLMIVDLLRNDLSRVAAAGSVAVPRLFEVETYPTVHTMTSTVTATLAEGRDAIDTLGALFPCGSITGAPKLRAMEVIAEVERRTRGIYTGAIGRLDANGDAAFNVAIRTLHLREGDDRAAIGLGSGIVADSEPGAEWRECLDKGRFVASAQKFDLIETMAFDPEIGFPLLERHFARISASAETFGFAFDRHAARNELQAATFRLRGAAKVRMLLAQSGALAVEVRPAPPVLTEPVEVAIVPLPVDPADFRLRHKTTDRAFYDDARRAAGTFEVIFARLDGLLTEGSFTSLYVERDGMLLTPPLALGLLPSVLRAQLLDEGRAVEAELCANEVGERLLIGNALRGLVPARLVATKAASGELR